MTLDTFVIVAFALLYGSACMGLGYAIGTALTHRDWQRRTVESTRREIELSTEIQRMHQELMKRGQP